MWSIQLILSLILYPPTQQLLLRFPASTTQKRFYQRSTSIPSSRSRNNNNQRTQYEKLAPLEFEESLLQRGYKYVIGTDEVGRGSIAGPVVAVSCCILHDPTLSEEEHGGDHKLVPIDCVTDSKMMAQDRREAIYEEVVNSKGHQYKFTVSQRSPVQIDETNILKATMECFKESIQTLVMEQNFPLDETYAIVDGKSTPKLVNGPTPIPCRPLVSADKHIYTVSIASILAKVIRDEMMMNASKLYPEYSFDVNKGYTTRDHIEAIHKYGPSPIHRMSFKALQHR